MVKSVPSESHSLVKSVPSEDYLISTPAAGRSASFISESLRTAPGHIIEMTACSRGHITACELLQKLVIITNHDLVSHASINLPIGDRLAPLSPQPECFFARGSGPSRHATSHGNRRPPPPRFCISFAMSVRVVNQTFSWVPLSALT